MKFSLHLVSSRLCCAVPSEQDHFGYCAGRCVNICPGIHPGERNLLIGIAKLLWAFEFRELAGAKNDLSAETESSQGVLYCLRDDGCYIRLRSLMKLEMIKRESEQAQQVFDRFD